MTPEAPPLGLADLWTAGLRPDELLAQVVTALGRQFDWVDVGVLLVDPADPEQLVLRASNYAGFPEAVGNFRQPRANGLVGRAMRTGRQVLVPDVRQDADYLPLPGVNIQSELVTPIFIGGHLAGVLNAESLHLISAQAAAFTQQVVDQLGAALAVAA